MSTTADQVTCPSGLTVATDGVTAAYASGDLLPPATSGGDLATRAALRAAGMLRTVTVTTSAADLAAAALSASTGTAAPGPPAVDVQGNAIIADY